MKKKKKNPAHCKLCGKYVKLSGNKQTYDFTFMILILDFTTG